MSTPDTPRAAAALLRQLVGWSTASNYATGTCDFNGLSEETDGDGKRKRTSYTEDVESFLIQSRHVDGRAFVALWMRRAGKGWTLDTAWRGRHLGELTPKQVTATELKAYVAAPDARSAIRPPAELKAAA